jgi:hypothetical protein
LANSSDGNRVRRIFVSSLEETLKHQAACSCGQLKLSYEGEVAKTSICHCFECQKRTGSAFGVQTRLDKNKAHIEGRSTEYIRTGDEGGRIRSHFCPACGSTVFWFIDVEGFKESIIVAVGAFENPKLPAPTFSVYGARKHHWVEIPSSVTDDWD